MPYRLACLSRRFVRGFLHTFDHGVQHIHIQRQNNASPAVPFGAIIADAGRAAFTRKRVRFGLSFGINRGHHGGVKRGFGVVVAGNGHERFAHFAVSKPVLAAVLVLVLAFF